MTCGFALLGYPDSNQERQDQNLQCYHYTIPQSFFHFASAKVLLFFKLPTFFATFFIKNIKIGNFSLVFPRKRRIFAAWKKAKS